nr:hypothetical protein [Tanacetum cinerariifolium]
MERSFLSPKEKRGGRGVKEKDGGSGSSAGFIFGSSLKLGDDASFKLGEIPSSSQEGFVVTYEPLQPDVNATEVNDADNKVGQTPASNTPSMSSDANNAGKRVAYPIVANYAKNTWGKIGLNPGVSLLKEDMRNVPVWVKLYGVRVTAFCKNGLSAITTKLELKDNIVVAMPKLFGEGYYTYVVKNMKKPSQTSRGVPVGPKVLPVSLVERPILMEKLIIERKVTLVDDEESYENGDYDFDPYDDDDMYERQDINILTKFKSCHFEYLPKEVVLPIEEEGVVRILGSYDPNTHLSLHATTTLCRKPPPRHHHFQNLSTIFPEPEYIIP